MGNQSEFHSERNYYLQNWYFSCQKAKRKSNGLDLRTPAAKNDFSQLSLPRKFGKSNGRGLIINASMSKYVPPSLNKIRNRKTSLESNQRYLELEF